MVNSVQLVLERNVCIGWLGLRRAIESVEREEWTDIGAGWLADRRMSTEPNNNGELSRACRRRFVARAAAAARPNIVSRLFFIFIFFLLIFFVLFCFPTRLDCRPACVVVAVVDVVVVDHKIILFFYSSNNIFYFIVYIYINFFNSTLIRTDIFLCYFLFY